MRRQTLIRAFMFAAVGAGLSLTAMADTLKPLDSDREADRIDWSQLDAKFGPAPKMGPDIKVGAVAKTLINEYWRSLGEGYTKAGKTFGVTVDLQAAQNEGD
jgi:ribose transport system substrate-binding protein